MLAPCRTKPKHHISVLIGGRGFVRPFFDVTVSYQQHKVVMYRNSMFRTITLCSTNESCLD